MDEYLANRPDQIVDTAIRCLTNLSMDDIFAENASLVFDEAAKKEEEDSLKEKVVKTLNKAADAIENRGKADKDRAEKSAKWFKFKKNLPEDKKVKVRDMKREKTIIRNTHKELKRAQEKGEDKSVVDKIMETYRNHKKAIVAAMILVPAFFVGLVNGYKDAVDGIVKDNGSAIDKIVNDVNSGKMDPQTASAYGAAFSELSNDAMKAEAEDFSKRNAAAMAAAEECADALNAIRGKS